MVAPALEHGGYSYKTQADIGKRPGGSRHKVDILAERSKSKFLISLKWQQVSGTAEQKVPFEAICLIDIMRKEEYEKAYLVLGGNGWSLRGFYINGGLDSYIRDISMVQMIDLESFVRLANSSTL